MPAPTKYPDWATAGDNVVEPPSGKVAAGWVNGEQPPSGWFNWWQGIVGQWTRWLDSQVVSLTGRVTAVEADVDAVQGTLDTTVAHQDQENTFTQPQTIDAALDVSGDITTDADVAVGGEVRVTNEVFAGGSLYTGPDPELHGFVYGGLARTRTVTINPASGFGDGSTTNNGQYVTLVQNTNILYPVVVPHGAAMKSMAVKLYAPSNATYTCRLVRRHSIDFLGGIAPVAVVDTTTGTASGVVNVLDLEWNITANSAEDYGLYISNDQGGGGGAININAIQFVYEEQVVRTYGSR